MSISSGIRLDPCISQQTQPNYTARIKWHAHPEADVLGDALRIGWVKGAHDFVSIPEVTASEVRWARAQGGASDMADHPDAETAVRAICSDGRIREHLKPAVVHLLKANPRHESVEVFDHAVDIADKLRDLIGQNRDAIDVTLKACRRDWGDVWQYLPGNMADWAVWVMTVNRPARTQDYPTDLRAARQQAFGRSAGDYRSGQAHRSRGGRRCDVADRADRHLQVNRGAQGRGRVAQGQSGADGRDPDPATRPWRRVLAEAARGAPGP